MPDILAELGEYGIDARVSDPLADPQAAAREYGITLSPPGDLVGLDALVLAVNHAEYCADPAGLVARGAQRRRAGRREKRARPGRVARGTGFTGVYREGCVNEPRSRSDREATRPSRRCFVAKRRKRTGDAPAQAGATN